MPDASTLAVLQDVVSVSLLAAVVGACLYAMLRRMVPMAAWDHGGHVNAAFYGWRDAVVAGLLVLLLCGGLFGPEAVAAGAKAKAVESASATEQLTSVASSVLMDFTVVALIIGFLRVLRDQDPAELFGLRKMAVGRAFVRAAVWLVPAMVAVLMVSAAGAWLLRDVWPDAGPQSAVQMLEKSQSVVVRVALTIMAVIVAPLSEEILFRGFLFGVLKRYTDTYFAALVSSLLFASVHMHVGFFLPLFALGIIFSAAYEATGCLLVSIFMHAMFNGAQEIMMLFGAK